MKTAIIFHSRYGVSRQYAIWISEQMKADIFNIDHINTDNIQDYDNLIILSGILYNRISILSSLKKYQSLLKEKKIHFILCTMNDDSDSYHQELKQYFNASTEVFYLPGYIWLDKLSLWDKIQIKVTKVFNPNSTFLSSLEKMKCPKRSYLDSLLMNINK